MIRLRLLATQLLGAIVLSGAVHAATTDSPTGLALFAIALTASFGAAVCCLIAVRPEPAVGAIAARGHALRERARLAAFIPQRDPDAAGRPRPRAPGAAHAAA